MANPNALIVEVVGDTRKLKAGLADAERDLKRFSSRSAASMQQRIETGPLGDTLKRNRELQAEAEATTETLAKLEGQVVENEASFRRFALGAAVLGVGINRLATNLGELGGEGERFDKAISHLMSGNFVGFYNATRDNTEAIKAWTKELVEAGDAAESTRLANMFAAEGFGGGR